MEQARDKVVGGFVFVCISYVPDKSEGCEDSTSQMQKWRLRAFINAFLWPHEEHVAELGFELRCF